MFLLLFALAVAAHGTSKCVPGPALPLRSFPTSVDIPQLDCQTEAKKIESCSELPARMKAFSENQAQVAQTMNSYLTNISQWADCSYNDLKTLIGASHEIKPGSFDSLRDGASALNDVNGIAGCNQAFLDDDFQKISEAVSKCMKPTQPKKAKN